MSHCVGDTMQSRDCRTSSCHQELLRRNDAYELPLSYRDNFFFLSFIDNQSIFTCWNVTYKTLSYARLLLDDFQNCSPLLRILHYHPSKKFASVFCEARVSHIPFGNWYFNKEIEPGLYWGEIGFLQSDQFSFFCCLNSNQIHTHSSFSASLNPHINHLNGTNPFSHVWNKLNWTFDHVSEWSQAGLPIGSSGSGGGRF